MPTPIETVTAELAAKRKDAEDLINSKKNADGRPVMTAEERDLFQAKQKEINSLAKVREDLLFDLENTKDLAVLNEPVHPSAFGRGGVPAPVRKKSLAEAVVETKEFKAANSGGVFRPTEVYLPDFDLKTTMMETGPGYAPANDRTDRVVLSAQRRVMVTDLIPTGTTTLSVIKYMEETTFTNNFGTRAENAALGESALAYTEVPNTVEKIGAILPVTEEQLDDVPGLMTLINDRLTYQMEQTKETQVLTGTGTTPQLKGFLTLGSIQTQARGSDNIPDAVLRAINLVRVNGQTEPSGGVMHPNDWMEVQLMRTADGLYIWGHPNQPTNDARIWGVPFVVAQAITEGTSLVGDFRGFSTLWYNRGVRVDLGFINDDFQRVKKTIRMYARMCLEVRRQAAFCKLTGM